MSAKSPFVGTQGNDLQGKINILNCSFIQSLQCHVVNGEMNGNPICSSYKDPAEHWGTQL